LGRKRSRDPVFYFFCESQPENEKESVRNVSNGLEVGAHLGLCRTRYDVGCRTTKALPGRAYILFVECSARRIVETAPEPLQTFLWLAFQTAMRAGALCGLRVRDIDFDRSTVHVCQSAWCGKIQSPKSERAVRCFALSPRLLARLAEHCKAWTPNEAGLPFATRNGTPWDANLLVKWKLYPLLDSLRVERCG
jgi:hypothetical protein